jgi:hypothetical protein
MPQLLERSGWSAVWASVPVQEMVTERLGHVMRDLARDWIPDLFGVPLPTPIDLPKDLQFAAIALDGEAEAYLCLDSPRTARRPDPDAKLHRLHAWSLWWRVDDLAERIHEVSALRHGDL